MHIKKFRDLYLTELQELRSGEMQLVVTVRHMAEAASNESLAAALRRHRDGAQARKERLDRLIQRHGTSQEHSNKAIDALVQEANRLALLLSSEVLRDAGIILAVQKLIHYQIASYGAAAALAGAMELRQDQRELHLGLEEEKHTDLELTGLAKEEVNPEAAASDEVSEAQEEKKAEEEGTSKKEVEKA